jgi:hypothetical protein
MSEEDEADGANDSILFASAAPRVATTVTMAAPAAAGITEHDEPAQSRPAPRDYAPEFAGTQPAIAEPATAAGQTGKAQLAEPAETPGISDRDLDVPTFLRRVQF